MSATQLRHAFLSLTCVLLGVGMLMVYSASITARPSEIDEVYLTRHVVFLCVSALAGVIASLLPVGFWRKAAPWLFALTVLLLIVVLIPGIGHRVNGARRWLRFGMASMQPSEFAKLTMPLIVCWWLDRIRGLPDAQSSTFWRTSLRELHVGLPIALTIGLVLVEPDLGTAAFLSGVAAVTLFLYRWPLVNFCLAASAALPIVIGAATLRPYQIQRVTGFLAAWQDFEAAPYQVQQSLTTLGVGGVRGVGLGSGWQKLSFLPEANTDFVFAVVGEELGLIGTLGLLGLWAAVYFCGVRLFAGMRTTTFESTVGIVLLIQLVAQAGLNMAIVTSLVPPKGIAHPLVSYGGSSLLASVIALGMIISLSRSSMVEPHGSPRQTRTNIRPDHSAGLPDLP